MNEATTMLYCETCKEPRRVLLGRCGVCLRPFTVAGVRLDDEIIDIAASSAERTPRELAATHRMPASWIGRRVGILWTLAEGLTTAQLAALPPLAELVAAHEALSGLTVEVPVIGVKDGEETP